MAAGKNPGLPQASGGAYLANRAESGNSACQGGVGQDSVRCPICGSVSVWRDGVRCTGRGEVQRWLCRLCGFRFSHFTQSQVEVNVSREILESSDSVHDSSNIHPVDFLSCKKGLDDLSLSSREDVGSQGFVPSSFTTTGKDLNITFPYNGERQVCALNGEAKNLAEVEKPPKNGLAGATWQAAADAKGKIVEHSFWLLKQGYAESTIKGRTKLLKILVKRGADLFDPETVKETIAKQKWSEGRKVNAVDAYTCFLQMLGKSWQPPKYKRVRKLPFIPTENEVDQLIAGCGRKTATLLQLLKETGMRIGEAWKLQWTEIDFLGNIIRVTPEKGSNPRVFKVSNKLMSMLKALQERSSSNRVFQKSLRSQARLFHKQRRKIASKLQNPRLMNISFHTLRHWKATTEYHKTKDILHVMKVLGHKNINNTLVYTQLVDFGDEQYTVKVAHTLEEDKQLIEAGFEYVTERDGYKIYRKRK